MKFLARESLSLWICPSPDSAEENTLALAQFLRAREMLDKFLNNQGTFQDYIDCLNDCEFIDTDEYLKTIENNLLIIGF